MKVERNFGLDILRAYAILSVLIGHGTFITGPNRFYSTLKWFLFDGVGVFFVLSGFLIGRILIFDFQKYGINIGSLFYFWFRRWFRTLPLYFAILIAVGIAFLFEGRISPKQYVPYWLFLNNFNTPPPTRFFGESWSLAVEEWFYLLIPFSFFLITNKKERIFHNIMLLGVLLIVVIMCHKILTLNKAIADTYYHQTVLYRLDSLIFGVLLANIYVFKEEILIKYKNILFIIGLSMLVLLQTKILDNFIGGNSIIFNNVFSDTYFSIAISLLIPFLIEIKTKKASFVKLITFISMISYSLYLTHLTLVQKIIWNIVVKVTGISKTASHYVALHYIFYWTVSFVISYILYRIIEKPFMEMRKNYPFVRFDIFFNKEKYS